jgi:hypothetical protein
LRVHYGAQGEVAVEGNAVVGHVDTCEKVRDVRRQDLDCIGRALFLYGLS